MEKELYITINGTIGSGKTTLSLIIKKALEDNGFQTIIKGEDSININNLNKKIKSLKEKFPIIKIKQFNIRSL